MNKINTYALVERWQWIRDHPDEWDQLFWFRRWDCGTAACFAGSTVLAAGGKPFYLRDRNIETSMVQMPDGTVGAVGGVAARLLGIDREQASELFASTNTLDDLADLIETWTGLDPRMADLATLPRPESTP